MEKETETPLFETTMTWLEKLFVAGQIGLGFLGLVYFASKFTKADWGGQLFMCFFFVIWIVQAIRVAKTFHLFADRLVIRRPFFFTTKTDQTFKIDEIKEVIFRRIKGRFGGPHLIVKAKRLNDDFRIDFGTEIRNDFIAQLTKLGVKVSSENM